MTEINAVLEYLESGKDINKILSFKMKMISFPRIHTIMIDTVMIRKHLFD